MTDRPANTVFENLKEARNFEGPGIQFERATVQKWGFPHLGSSTTQTLFAGDLLSPVGGYRQLLPTIIDHALKKALKTEEAV